MRLFIVILCMTLSLFASDLTLEIVKDVGNLPKIAIEVSPESIEGKIGQKFFKLLLGDLKVTSHFDTISSSIEYAKILDPIDYAKYKDVAYLLRYKLFYDDFGDLEAKAVVYDIKTSEPLFQKLYRLRDKKRYPFIAHKIVYDLNEALHFPDVAFLKSFVIFAKYIAPKRSDIVLSDYTLTYQKTIVHGGLNIFPKWADKEQRSFYYTDMQGRPTLYRVDIYKGVRTKILSGDGMLVCSDVSADGSRLLLTMAPDDQPDIYEYNLHTHTLRRVTRYPGIDVNGNYIEDGSRVVFVSDRLGNPTIFAKRIDSDAVERIVYHGKNNSALNSFDHYIVYSSRESDNAFGPNTFNLYLTSTTSDYIRRLTANGVNIFPRFSSDGETVLFIKEFQRQTALGVIRLKYNKSYLFPLYTGKIQSIDW